MYDIRSTNCSIIFSPNITVIKDVNYKNLINPFTVNMIAASAIKHPQLRSDGTYKPNDQTYMDTLIDNIFRSAFMHNQDTLVLGAIGCGAYGHKSIEVIKIFNKYLAQYNGCFKKIVFAVYSTQDDNFDYFNQFISK